MWKTKGHEAAVRTIARAVSSSRLAHAYSIIGPPNVGKTTLALDIACVSNCLKSLPSERPCGVCSQCVRIMRALHADIQFVGREVTESNPGRMATGVTIDQIRNMQTDAHLRPFEGSYRVFIVQDAELIDRQAYASLLKFLEEPPPHVIIVLLSSGFRILNETIGSRCQFLKLKPVKWDIVVEELQSRSNIDRDEIIEIVRASQGRLGWAIDAISDDTVMRTRQEQLVTLEKAISGTIEERYGYTRETTAKMMKDRGYARQHLELWLTWWRDVFLVKTNATEYITNSTRLESLKVAANHVDMASIVGLAKSILNAREFLEMNARPSLVLNQLMLDMPYIEFG